MGSTPYTYTYYDRINTAGAKPVEAPTFCSTVNGYLIALTLAGGRTGCWSQGLADWPETPVGGKLLVCLRASITARGRENSPLGGRPESRVCAWSFSSEPVNKQGRWPGFDVWSLEDQTDREVRELMGSPVTDQLQSSGTVICTTISAGVTASPCEV